MRYSENEFVWAQSYRPHTLDDCIIPPKAKEVLQSYITEKRIPSLLLAGPAGQGKTTCAMAICEDIGADYIMINASLDANIDAIRTTISQFASTTSLTAGAQKVVIWDELDHAPSASVQPAMRSFMEEFSSVCSHIITCNFKHRIIDAIQSRCQEIDITVKPTEKPAIAAQFFKRVCNILKQEGVDYDKQAVAELIAKSFPDYRRVLNTLQMYSRSGKIDAGILVNDVESSFTKLITILKDKKFTEMRRWLVENFIPSEHLYRIMFEKSSTFLAPASVPELILILARYQYQEAFVTDKELNTAAMLTECMGSLSYVP